MGGSDSEIDKSAMKEREKKKMQALAPIAKPFAGKKLAKKTLKLVRKGLNLSVKALAPIVKHFAGKKLAKCALKLVRKGAEHKCLKRGVKEVVKSIRRGSKGLCVIAGNISPIDVITHVPVLCEEAEIPYIYVPSKEDLANAGSTKRPTCCVLVLTKPAKGEIGKEDQEQLQADYDSMAKEISEITASMF